MTARSPAPGRPASAWRGLLLLTLLVLLLHWILLEASAFGMRTAEDSPLAHSFTTRTILLAPTTPEARPTARPSPPASPAPAAAAPAPPATRGAPRPAPATVQTPQAEAPSTSVPSSAPPAQAAPEPREVSSDAAASAVNPSPDAPSASIAASSSGPSSVAASPAPGASVESGAVSSLANRRFAIPGSVRLQYTLSALSRQQPLTGGVADVRWLTDGKRYDLRQAWSFLFATVRSQTSVGEIGVDGLRPERFSDTRRSEVAAHFEREKGKITFSANTPDVALIAGAQDRLSLFFQLSALVAGDPSAYPTGTAVSFQTVGPRDAEVWRFAVVDRETLHLPAGEMEALKLQSTSRQERNQTVEIWLAPSLGYLPVRIRLTEANGDTAEQRLRAYGPP